MTRERARELLPVIQAFAEGERIQVKTPYKWRDYNDDELDLAWAYRIAPKPKTRPMTRGEALYKVTTTPGMVVSLASCINPPNTYLPASCLSHEDISMLDKLRWAIIDASGEPIDGWHKFEVEE